MKYIYESQAQLQKAGLLHCLYTDITKMIKNNVYLAIYI